MELSPIQEELLKKLESVGSNIDKNDIISTLFGIDPAHKNLAAKNTEEVKRSVNEMIGNSTKFISRMLNDPDSSKKVLGVLMGVSPEEIDTTPLKTLNKDLYRQISELNSEIANELRNIGESSVEAINLRNNAQKKINDRVDVIFDQIKSNVNVTIPSDRLEALKQQAQQQAPKEEVKSTVVYKEDSSAAILEKYLSKLDDKYSNLVSLQKEKITLDESKIDKVVKLSGVDSKKVKDFYKLAIQKKREVDPFSKELFTKGNTKITLDEKSITEILNGLNLSKLEEKKLFKSIHDTLTESNETLDKIEKKPTSEGSILSMLAGGLGTAFTSLVGGLVSLIGPVIYRFLIGPLATIAGALGVTGLALGLFGDQIGNVLNSITGTNYGTTAVSGLKNVMGVNKPGGLDFYKNLGLAYVALKNTKPLLKSGAGKVITRTAKDINKYTVPMVRGIKSGAQGAVNLAKKLRNTKNAVNTAKATASAAVQTAANVAKSGNVLSKSLNALKGVGTAISRVMPSFSTGIFGGAVRGILGTVLKRIPLFSGLYELGIAIKRFSDGDFKGGILRLLSASTNLLYLLGPEMAFLQIPLSWWLDSLDEKATEDTGGNVEAKQNMSWTGIFGRSPIGSSKTQKKSQDTISKKENIRLIEKDEINYEDSSDKISYFNDKDSKVLTLKAITNPPSMPTASPTPPSLDLPIPKEETPKPSVISDESVQKLGQIVEGAISSSKGGGVSITGGGSSKPDVSIYGGRNPDQIYETKREYKARNYSKYLNP